LGVGASFVPHSAANSAVALGGKISGSIKRARSHKLEQEEDELPKRWGDANDDDDSKCASIKRKITVASEPLHDTSPSKKKKKKSKMSAVEPAPSALVIAKPSQQPPKEITTNLFLPKQKALHSAETPVSNSAATIKQSQPPESSRSAAEAAHDCSGAAEADLGNGLRNFKQGERKRTKTRSKAKNLKKDKRPPELRPGGEK